MLPGARWISDVTGKYVERISNILEHGVWMTEEPGFGIHFDTGTVDVPPADFAAACLERATPGPSDRRR